MKQTIRGDSKEGKESGKTRKKEARSEERLEGRNQRVKKHSKKKKWKSQKRFEGRNQSDRKDSRQQQMKRWWKERMKVGRKEKTDQNGVSFQQWRRKNRGLDNWAMEQSWVFRSTGNWNEIERANKGRKEWKEESKWCITQTVKAENHRYR